LYTNGLLNPLSLRSNRPLEPWKIEVLATLHAAFCEYGCPYMLVGATARDLLLFHVHGGPHPSRHTRDIDFAIAVNSWEAFEAVRNALLAQGKFKPSKVQHRLLYSSLTVTEAEVDVIPFGGIASPEETITWPPELDTAMNVAGFEEALAAGVWISITEALTVPVVSLPGLAVLKLFAWSDRRLDRDATDMSLLMRFYADAGNEDRLYDSSLAAEFGFDLELAGAKLLGADVVALCWPVTLQKLQQIFTPDNVEKLVNHMIGHRYRMDDSEPREIQLVNVFFGPILSASSENTA
jgi:predicted nucleotidyltransferase